MPIKAPLVFKSNSVSNLNSSLIEAFTKNIFELISSNCLLVNDPADLGIIKVLLSKLLVGYINSIWVDSGVYVGKTSIPIAFKLSTTCLSFMFKRVIAATLAPNALAA